MTGATCTIIMDDGTVCGYKTARGPMCEAHRGRAVRGADMGAPINRKVEYSPTCTVDVDGVVCGEPSRSIGLCSRHYYQDRAANAKPKGECGVEFVDGTFCTRPARTAGLCGGHYQRKQKGQDLAAPMVTRGSNVGKNCQTPDCAGIPTRRGYCGACYQRLRTTVPGFATGKRGVAVCCVDGCEKLVQSRDMCNMHYQRWQDYGDPGAAEPKRINGTEAERFWPKVDKSGDCWLWTGALDPSGYGLFRGSESRAHRVAYALSVGPIPEDMAIHHMCGTRACVNPDHLVPATANENAAESLRCKALEAEVTRLKTELAQARAEAADYRSQIPEWELAYA